MLLRRASPAAPLLSPLCSALPAQTQPRRGLALESHGPPKRQRGPGQNNWTVGDKLSRSSKCDPYELGGEAIPAPEVRRLPAPTRSWLCVWAAGRGGPGRRL